MSLFAGQFTQQNKNCFKKYNETFLLSWGLMNKIDGDLYIYGATFEDNMTSHSQDIMEKQIQR